MPRKDTQYAVTVERSDRERPDLFMLSGPRKGLERFMRDMLGDRLVKILHIAGPFPLDEELPESADPYGVMAAHRRERERALAEHENLHAAYGGKSAAMRKIAAERGIPVVDLSPETMTLDMLIAAAQKARDESQIGGGTVVYLSEPELDYMPIVEPYLDRDEDGAVFLLHVNRLGQPHDMRGLPVEITADTLRDVPVHVLTDALRDRGLPVCVFQPEDLVDGSTSRGRLKRARAWLADHRGKFEDAMSEAGNHYIGDTAF